MGLDLSNFGGLVSNLGSLMPTPGAVLENVALGAAASVVTSGLKAQLGGGALDPLGLFHNQAPANNPNAMAGPTITASAYAALPATTQAQLMAAGVHIVAG